LMLATSWRPGIKVTVETRVANQAVAARVKMVCSWNPAPVNNLQLPLFLPRDLGTRTQQRTLTPRARGTTLQNGRFKTMDMSSPTLASG